MTEAENPKRFDLEERTEEFARGVRSFLKMLPRRAANDEDGRQLLRASGSVGANYIEANEAVSRKDFILRIKICRKEAKECGYWLRLLDLEGTGADVTAWRDDLVREATELMKIFGAILRKSE